MQFKIFIPFFLFLSCAVALFSQSSESLLIDFAVVKTQYPGETPQRCIAAVKDNRVIMRDLYADGSAGPLMYYDLGAGLHYECRQEKRRDLNTLVREFRKKDDVVFLAIGYDQAEKIRDFTARKRFAYTQAYDGRRVAGLYKVEGFPTNVIIAPNGRISSSRSGYFSRNNENMLREAIYSARKITGG